MLNFIWLGLVVVVVATLDPAADFPGTQWRPVPFLREGFQLLLVAVSFLTTPSEARQANDFNFRAIGEVAALFVGIFITLQIPLEILSARGGELGLSEPWQFFWVTGALSGFLDNAPTYAVFFQVASAATPASGPGMLHVLDGSHIREDLLVAISFGAVFMGALTYIGNGPNFMVKSIAEQQGIRMPTFFGYLCYSICVPVPILVLLTLVLL